MMNKMEKKNYNEFSGYIKRIESNLSKYKYLIGICIIFLMLVLIILTIKNFEKQNQIIETGGFTDGKIKCVCTKNAWDEYVNKNDLNLNNILNKDG